MKNYNSISTALPRRVAVFVDLDNVVSSYNDHFSARIHWNSFNQRLLTLCKDSLPLLFRGVEPILVETRVFTGVQNPNDYARLPPDLKKIDKMEGFVVKYGIMQQYTSKNGNTTWKQKAVDTELVCNMVRGAYSDLYDVAVLTSDDKDFLPVVELVQDVFGKPVVCVSFEDSMLRARCYGHIPMERKGKYFTAETDV